jgi:ABC-type molybdate transport system ATPase subunit
LFVYNALFSIFISVKGKTSLLRILTGEEEPDEGEVIIGETVCFLKLRKIRRKKQRINKTLFLQRLIWVMLHNREIRWIQTPLFSKRYYSVMVVVIIIINTYDVTDRLLAMHRRSILARQQSMPELMLPR